MGITRYGLKRPISACMLVLVIAVLGITSLFGFSVDLLPELDMPVSAKHMILHYLKVGRFDDVLYAGITEEEGTKFTVMREF